MEGHRRLVSFLYWTSHDTKVYHGGVPLDPAKRHTLSLRVQEANMVVLVV